ncbi:hypothetical protein [Chitinophaga arvensicola]|uniref:Uncharacterized protein n=1 Tax=Chitinophaga arvensicola TaxID=29529 RepID=A0A1I0QXU5_9BACT|nr:hypothetical protein [Chitinophaga arvensicola]SEW32400.1 hypothetical protein SAMN04488122_1859 [Chitinophaga arvensicola]
MNHFSKITWIVPVLITLFGCQPRDKKNNHQTPDLSAVCPESDNIQSITRYLFFVDVKDLSNDSCMNHHYRCVKGTGEEEGVEWLSFSYYKDKDLAFVAETDWVDTTRIARITFLSANFQLRNGLPAVATFKEIKNELDTLKRKNYPDGSLEFYLKGDTSVIFTFDVTNNETLYYGYQAINEIPDTLRATSVVVFR